MLRDFAWLTVLALVFIGSGIGWRDPWPPDEPRFVAIARDMVASGQWLFPHVGGELYQDKPPLYFWLLAAGFALTGSERIGFLLPSFAAACGVLFLVHDLARRIAGRGAAITSAVLLGTTMQFVITMRGAQIDPTLLLLTTLSLYGFLRHLLYGPAWGWYLLAGLAAGLGVIAKGVGFLPMLILLLYVLMRLRRWNELPSIGNGVARWALAPGACLLGISLWLVPMWLAVQANPLPELLAYRDEILLQQTVQRYAGAWQHERPAYYFLTAVIPWTWLPVSALVFWLAPRWSDAWRERRASVWLPLAWAILVVAFFSATPGKRSVYVLPALPAVILAAAPYLEALLQRRGVRAIGICLAAVLLCSLAIAWIGAATGSQVVQQRLQDIGLTAITPLGITVVAGGLALIASVRRDSRLAWPVTLGAVALMFSWLIVPVLNPVRSGEAFIHAVQRQLRPEQTLGLVAYQEQFLLYLDRPAVNFGHRRWREEKAESYDAAAWLNAGPNRVLLMKETTIAECFGAAEYRRFVGKASRHRWWLVGAPARESCERRGKLARAVVYAPPLH